MQPMPSSRPGLASSTQQHIKDESIDEEPETADDLDAGDEMLGDALRAALSPPSAAAPAVLQTSNCVPRQMATTEARLRMHGPRMRRSAKSAGSIDFDQLLDQADEAAARRRDEDDAAD